MNQPADRLAETYDPRRFRATVPFYARYRLAYPESLICRVVEIVGLKPGDRVMDLGCGPGLLAVPFAQAGMAVTGVDPEPEMLAALSQAAKGAGVAVDIRRGSSFDMPTGIGPFRLVTMGRAFHWMDRAATLEILDRLVEPNGAVVHFEDDHPRTVENRWRIALRDLANRYGRAQSHHIVEAESSGYRTHESMLLDSPFSRLERIGVVIRRAITADEIVGFAFSLSTTSPEKLGGQMAAFERDLRAELETLSPDGRFTEIAELSALVTWRG